MQHTAKSVPLTDITVGVNVRLPNRYSIPNLAADIMQRGLITPILCWLTALKVIEVLQGHRRLAAIKWIEQNNPAAFSKWFGKGVPIIMVDGITADEALTMKVDHGNELSLSDPFELQMCANLLFQSNHTEEFVIIELASLMERLNPMKSDKSKELATMRVDLADAKEKKDATRAAKLEEGIVKLLFEYRRGMVQNLHNTFRCPDVVMAALYFKATGETPDGYAGEYLPKLTTGQVTALWKAHKDDLEIRDGKGLPKYSKKLVGPNFREKWAQLIEAEKRVDSEPETTRPKAMSAKDIDAEVKEGKWSSPFAHALCLHFLGNKQVEGLAEMDTRSYQVELVAKHDPKAYESFKKTFLEIEGEVIALNKDAKPTATEKKVAKLDGHADFAGVAVPGTQPVKAKK
jgi:hypothetical protein